MLSFITKGTSNFVTNAQETCNASAIIETVWKVHVHFVHNVRQRCASYASRKWQIEFLFIKTHLHNTSISSIVDKNYRVNIDDGKILQSETSLLSKQVCWKLLGLKRRGPRTGSSHPKVHRSLQILLLKDF